MFAELDDEVRTLLTPALVARYDAILAAVADARPRFEGIGRLVHRRAHMQFRLNTGMLRKGGRSGRRPSALELSVRVAGRSVGTLKVASRTSRTFVPHTKNFRSLREWDAPLPWPDKRVAKYIADVYESSLSADRPEFDPEARVEAAFIAAFDTKQAWTRNHRIASRVGSLAFQLPLPLGASAKATKVAGGYVDMLASVGRGQALRVFELKKPLATRRDAVHALRQAVIYTLVLKRLLLDFESAGYRRIVAVNDEGRIRPGLRFVASPFVAITSRDAVDELCARIRRDAPVWLDIRPTYYEWDDTRSTFNVVE
jgi:hypothetical protein